MAPNNRASRQRGMSLVMVVFILVVLSMLGAAMMKLLSSGADSVAREVLSIRALHAAESGAQRQLNTIFTGAGCANQSYNFPGLISCGGVATTCTVVSIGAVNYYTVRSTGSCGPVGEQAVRVVEVQARDI